MRSPYMLRVRKTGIEVISALRLDFELRRHESCKLLE